jgi:hypothetical protein
MCCLFWPALISLANEGIHNKKIIKKKWKKKKKDPNVYYWAISPMLAIKRKEQNQAHSSTDHSSTRTAQPLLVPHCLVTILGAMCMLYKQVGGQPHVCLPLGPHMDLLGRIL